MNKAMACIKKNICGFIVGVIVAGSIGVYAINISSNNVTYDNTNSGSSSSNVKGAIDDLYDQADNCITTKAPKYFEFGVPTTSSTQDYTTLDKNVFAALWESGKSGVCTLINDQLICLQMDNYEVEKKHIKEVFSSGSCTENDTYIECQEGEAGCRAYKDGGVSCLGNAGYLNFYCFKENSTMNCIEEELDI